MTLIKVTEKTTEEEEEEKEEDEDEMRDEVPFLPALALPPDSPTPPPSRPSSTLPPLPELGITSPERRRRVRDLKIPILTKTEYKLFQDDSNQY